MKTESWRHQKSRREGSDEEEKSKDWNEKHSQEKEKKES